MKQSIKPMVLKCDVCGGVGDIKTVYFRCNFCGFKKKMNQTHNPPNHELINVENVNDYFKQKHKTLKRGETFELTVPVSRFYKNPRPQPNQINFFKSKNIMFLIEQHGFQFVSRKSRFSTTLSLIIRKV